MNITPDLPFLNIHNPFTMKELAYTWTNIVSHVFGHKGLLNVKQIRHFSKGVVILASA